MTDQEKLAALLGPDGKRLVVFKDTMGNEYKREMEPKSPAELVEIAEGRLRKSGWHGWLTLPPNAGNITRPPCMHWRDAQGDTDAQLYCHGRTELEARSRAAIKALERLAGEEEKT